MAQLKSAGLRFAINSDDKGLAGTDKTHNFYKHVGETLSILGESGVGYKADLYSSRNLITYHDNDGIRIAMKTNPVFDPLTLVNKDDPSKSLELYAKTDNNGKAYLSPVEKDIAVKEKPQTPNNGTGGNHNTSGQSGASGQNGANGQNGSNANHGINGNNGTNGLSANETDLTRAAIKGLNQATGEINRQIRKTTRESRAGIAAAMAMGQIYPVQGKRFTVGAAAGTYQGQSAVAVGVRYTPKPNIVISLSGSADTNNGVGAVTGVSFGF